MEETLKTFQKQSFKLKDLRAIQNSLLKILNAEFSKYSTGYRLRRFAKKIESEFLGFEEERQRLIKLVGATISEDGSRWNIPADKQKEFDDNINALQNEEVVLEFMPVHLEDLDTAVFHNGVSSSRLTVLDLANLEFLIIDSGEKV